MNLEDFKKVVDQLKERPLPGKQVYVWNGDEKSLLGVISEELIQKLDLASDVQLEETNDYNETHFSRLIEKEIENKLIGFYSEVTDLKKQQVLVVSSSSILSRYKIGLTAFYNFYVGDRTMVVFVVPKPQVLVLPDYVRYDPDGTLKYLGNLVQPENIVE